MNRTQSILKRIKHVRELNGGRDLEIDKKLFVLEQGINKQIEAAMEEKGLFEKIQESKEGTIEGAERFYGIKKQEYDNIFVRKEEIDLELYCEMQIKMEKAIIKSLKNQKMSMVKRLKLNFQRRRTLKQCYKTQRSVSESFSVTSQLLDSLEASVAHLFSRVIPRDVQREVWRRDQGQCIQCESRLNLEFDHIIPVSKGGSNTVRNIQLLCQRCNREKYNNI